MLAEEKTIPSPIHLNTPKFRVGDRCRYCGQEGAMAVTCRGKILEVLEVRAHNDVMECKVKAPSWTVGYWIPVKHLRRERHA